MTKHIVLPELPFPQGALAPIMSAETLEYHHGKHHRGYVEKLNQLIQGTEYENLPLEEIIVRSGKGPVFNNAAQVWNHTFFWNCLTPGGKELRGELLMAIERDFGSVQDFRDQFNKAAVGQFGSGWAWLVLGTEGKLAIRTTSNAENPLVTDETALLTCDVWEHAYYIDYRNDRSRFVGSVFEVMNWELAERNFRAAGRMAAA